MAPALPGGRHALSGWKLSAASDVHYGTPTDKDTPMQPIATIHRNAPPIDNTLTVAVAADADSTQQALDQLDLAGSAIRALGLTDRFSLTASGLSWRPSAGSGRIDVAVDARVEPDLEASCWLTISTRFSATDEATRDRLLDAWPVVNPLARELVKRAARAVKESAEADRFERPVAIGVATRAAA
jgi:hypothetical protein